MCLLYWKSNFSAFSTQSFPSFNSLSTWFLASSDINIELDINLAHTGLIERTYRLLDLTTEPLIAEANMLLVDS